MAVHRRARRWWRHPATLAVVLAVVVAALVILSLVVVVKVGPPLRATAQPLVASHLVIAEPPSIVWPTVGEGAVSVPSSAVLRHSPRQAPVPIGSVAKVMVALQILTDHPLEAGQDGPSVTVSAADVAAWRAELLSDQSNVSIAVGETLTERQLLEGLLVHSGNDYAQILAELDAASVDAFVAKLNARAAAMGLVATHYADASGFDPATVSTPAEQLVVAAAAMKDPTFASIVKMTHVTLPVAGTVSTYTPLDGTNSVVGVKSGLTTEAAGCDVLALEAQVQGHLVLILSAVTGQQGADRLGAAGLAALDLARQAAHGFTRQVIATPRAPVAQLGWGHGTTPLVIRHELTLPVWPRRQVLIEVRLRRPITSTVHAGDQVGWLVARAGGVEVSEPMYAGSTLSPPTLIERVV